MADANPSAVEFLVVEEQRTTLGIVHQLLAGPFPQRAAARAERDALLPKHPAARIARMEWEEGI